MILVPTDHPDFKSQENSSWLWHEPTDYWWELENYEVWEDTSSERNWAVIATIELCVGPLLGIMRYQDIAKRWP